MSDWNLKPEEIEARSFAIIDEEAPPHDWDPGQWVVVRRMVHTTGDFEFVRTARFTPGAVEAGKAALLAGATIYTDTNMAAAGIKKAAVERLGGSVRCLIGDAEVALAARAAGTTRALAAVDAAVAAEPNALFVIGNAPTALMRLLDLAEAGKAAPALVVGLPVGFVNAAESKDRLAGSDLAFVTALGRKGGSALAASVINALLGLIEKG